ncbi:MAG: hypothetical protein WCO10_01520 [bacterium]
MNFEGNFFDPEAYVDKSELPKAETSFEAEKVLTKNESTERSERLKILWKKFGFKGNPPKEGSPVEERLFKTCEKYINIVINPELSRLPGSDPARRELHNQIALMVVGKQRTAMASDQAEYIADFACRVSKGFPLSQAIDLN